jgi:hypothetical protein
MYYKTLLLIAIAVGQAAALALNLGKLLAIFWRYYLRAGNHF